MTALAGYWSFHGKPPNDPCKRILQGQAAYGRSRSQSDDGVLALGRNLHPALPEDRFDTGPQAHAHFRLIADLRIDNRDELARSLGMSAAQHALLSDAALLFEALLKWGDEAIHRLIGEFAFAFWNGATRELLLGRDLLGLRPLVFHRAPSFFAFASMPSGLHALEDIPYQPNSEFLGESLFLLPRVGSATAFKHVERVEPGHLLRISERDQRSRAYWSPSRPSKSASAQDHAAGLRNLLDEVVAAQMRGAGDTVATQLSAGLDSSAVTATIATTHPAANIIAYTAVPRSGFAGRTPPGTFADGWALAAATARRYPNIEHVRVEGTGESPLRWLDRNFAYQQQPMANLANATWGQAIHAAAREAGSTVIFKASAGNLTISHSGLEYLPQLMAEGDVTSFARISLALLRAGMPAKPLAAAALGPFVPSSVWRGLRRMRGRTEDVSVMSAVNRAIADDLATIGKERGLKADMRPRRDPFHTRVDAFRRVDGGNAYKGVLGEWGLSVRDPTADRRVIEYCLAVPNEEFLRGGVPRSLARRAFADRLPPEVAGCRLRGYQSADWFEAMDKARPEIEDEIAAVARCAEACEVLDMAWLEDALASWPTDGDSATVRDRYRLGLLRGISAGHFVRKVKGTN